MSMIQDKASVLENRWQLISATLGRAVVLWIKHMEPSTVTMVSLLLEVPV